MIRRISLAALLLAVLASGCESPPPDAFVNTAGQAGGAAAVPVGANEVGEPCRYQAVSGGEGSARR